MNYRKNNCKLDSFKKRRQPGGRTGKENIGKLPLNTSHIATYRWEHDGTLLNTKAYFIRLDNCIFKRSTDEPSVDLTSLLADPADFHELDILRVAIS